MIEVMEIDTVVRGYLTTNQLTAVLNGSRPHVEATVSTTMTSERRELSWLRVGDADQALLVNRTTGTLFDPTTGQALNAAPKLIGAPFATPEMSVGRRVPPAILSTAQV